MEGRELEKASVEAQIGLVLVDHDDLQMSMILRSDPRLDACFLEFTVVVNVFMDFRRSFRFWEGIGRGFISLFRPQLILFQSVLLELFSVNFLQVLILYAGNLSPLARNRVNF